MPLDRSNLPTTARNKRENKLLIQRVIGVIYRLRLEGKTPNEVKEALADMRLGDERIISRCIRKADEMIGREMTRDQQMMYYRQIAKRENLYNRVVEKGDYQSAIMLLKDEARLMGLYPQQQNTKKQAELPLIAITEQDREHARKLLMAMSETGRDNQDNTRQETITSGPSLDESSRDNGTRGNDPGRMAKSGFIEVDFS